MALSDLFKDFEAATTAVVKAKGDLDAASARVSAATATYNASVATAQDLQAQLQTALSAFMPQGADRVRVS